MPGDFIRIISDLHFGDRASRIDRLERLHPLLAGVSHLVLNGDTLDTRPGPEPNHTAACAAAVREFFSAHVPATTFLTGNHDADFSSEHFLDLANDTVFVTHGDILFENLVPWSQDAALAGQRIAEELDRLPPALRDDLGHRLQVFRRVAHSIPQRHQSEKHGLRYLWRFLSDTLWPPHRILLVLHAWQAMPARASALARTHRAHARFILTGHTHRPGIWPTKGGVTVINTGSFALPLGALAVDLHAGSLSVRRIQWRGGSFHPGRTLATFPLAAP